MPLLRPLNASIDRQLAVDATAVILVNLVTLDTADEPRFLEAWQNDAAFMKRQPGSSPLSFTAPSETVRRM